MQGGSEKVEVEEWGASEFGKSLRLFCELGLRRMESFAEVLRITNPGKWVIIEKHSQIVSESHCIAYGGPEKTPRQEFLKET